MGWKGTIRSMNAAHNRYVRQLEKQERLRIKYNKQAEKEYLQSLAESEYEEYVDYIEQIVSLHKECNKPIDWEYKLNLPAPLEPQNSHSLEHAAKNKLKNYNPNFFIKILRLENRFKNRLSKEIELAKIKDTELFEVVHNKYKTENSIWIEQNTLAKRICKGDLRAYAEVIEKLNPFNNIKYLGKKVDVSIDDKKIAVVDVYVSGEEIIPAKSKTLLKSGKISEKDIPKIKRNQLYLDYVCGSLLRVANEMFCLLPVNIVYISAKDTLLDESNGHLKETTILSVQIPRDTIFSLNLVWC